MIYPAVYLIVLANVMASAHVCMWAPTQRNGFNIDTPGENLCYLKEGPCGGVASGEPLTTLVGGQDFSILFQQNLNHFYIENPGKLVADFANNASPVEEDFTALGLPVSDYNAMNEITQTNFSMKVQVPNVDCEHCVVRLRYLSNNPTENDRGTTFYQCADVKVVKQAAAPVTAGEVKKPTAPVGFSKSEPFNATLSECCAPKQFTLEGYETASWRNPTAKKYYFDAEKKLFRVDTNSGSGTGTKDGYFQMISDFNSGIEYYYNVNANTCGLYGLNYWSDWCYGSVNKQSFLQSVLVGTQKADVWVQEGSPFTWTNTQKSCVPVSNTRVDTGEGTFYFNMKTGAPDASVFTIPTVCKRAAEALGDKKKDLKAAPAHLSHF